MARLVVLSEGMTGLTHELKVEKTTIGRVEDNLFPIAEPSVSSHHCEVWLRGNDVVIKDLNSTNGTFIDGKQLTGEGSIKPGQILRLGQVQLRLESGVPAAANKKTLDHTMVIPQGVTMNELEQGTGKPVKFDTGTQFTKKGNRANLIFLVIGIVLGLLIVGLLVYAFMQQGNSSVAP
jgi:pSer/pThr/pTyr-binding forkhead associated (FHA) protein